MRIFLSFLTLTLLTVLLIGGCAETEQMDLDRVTTPSSMETMEPMEVMETPEERVFRELQDEYTAHLARQGYLTALRNITRSDTYLVYLGSAYPTEAQVKSLPQYAQVAPPDVDRYTAFFHELGMMDPTADDIAVLHHITLANREIVLANFDLRHQKRVGAFYQGLVTVQIIADLVVDLFGEHRMEEFEFIHAEGFAPGAGEFSNDTLTEDAVWLNAQMETHGIANGLLWSAIARPALMGEMMRHFSSSDPFLKWVEVTAAETE